jgi:large subunit ribosomal protein L14e
LVLVNYGPDAGKLAVIVEIIDQNRVLIDGPLSGVARQPISIRRLTLTRLVMDLPRGSRSPIVEKKMTSQNILAKWEETATAKKLAKSAVRKNLTDFERFKVMVAQKKKSLIVSSA